MKLKEWNFVKYLTEREMRFVVSKGEMRAKVENKATVFMHHGLEISPTKIESFRRKSIVEGYDFGSSGAGEVLKSRISVRTI